MLSPNKFIVKPKGNKQYHNTKKVGDIELIINTSIEEAKDVQRIAEVIATPILFKTDVRVGDEVVLWHNVFRITLNDKGIPMESSFYIKDGLFYVEPNLIYMVIRDGKYKAIHDNIFIEPIKENDKWEGENEKKHVGILKYGDNFTKSLGINEGDKVVYRKNCEYEFEIDGQRLYMMKNNRVLAKLN